MALQTTQHAYAAMAATVCLVVLSGCHKSHVAAYRPPPPPVRRYAPRPQPSVDDAYDPSLASNPSHKFSGPTVTTPSIDRGWGDTDGSVNATEVGNASWYGPPYHNRRGANGEIYDQNAMTAAHRTLPMGTTVRVTNVATGQSATVRITDRGPFVHGRIIDLSLAAAKATGVYRAGVAKVRVEVYGPQAALAGGKWCVQVGAFQHADNAHDLKSDLLRRYATAKVIDFAGPTGYWVRINPAASDHAHAQQIAQSIRTAEPDAQPYLVRLD